MVLVLKCPSPVSVWLWTSEFVAIAQEDEVSNVHI
jgi:hypothetical protein